DAIRAKTIKARELLELHLDRINSVNEQINAIVSLHPDRARVEAAAAEEQHARGDEIVQLHGLPIAIKDTHDVGRWMPQAGSHTRADYVPDEDELIVERARRAGAITIGKTNTPEYASGSHTFNPLFGTTYNPY